MTEKINPALGALVCDLAQFHPDPENAREHDTRGLEAQKASLSEFGQQKPIVALEDGTVIAGNGVYLAAKALGWSQIAVVRFADLAKARAFAIADNRSAELSKWSNQKLGAQLDQLNSGYEGFTPEMLGFTDAELMKLIGSVETEDIVDRAVADASAEDFSAPTGATPSSGADYSAPPADAPPSHVRMVQLFLDETTQPRFNEAVKVLGAAWGLQTVTDTVMRAVEDLAAQLKASDAA